MYLLIVITYYNLLLMLSVLEVEHRCRVDRRRGDAEGGEVEARQARAVVEHIREVGHLGGVPALHVERGQAAATVEHRGHRGHLGGVPSAEVEGLQARTVIEHIGHRGHV